MLHKVYDVKSAYAFVKEGWRMVKAYNWYDRTVMPYSFSVKVTKILHDIADYGKCTRSSQSYLNSLANGLVDILNHWEVVALSPMVVVEMDGKQFKMHKCTAEELELTIVKEV